MSCISRRPCQRRYANAGRVRSPRTGILDCDETYRRIGDLVGPELALTLAYLANGHRKEMFCDGIWGCDGTTADVSTKPYEVNDPDDRA